MFGVKSEGRAAGALQQHVTSVNLDCCASDDDTPGDTSHPMWVSLLVVGLDIESIKAASRRVIGEK